MTSGVGVLKLSVFCFPLTLSNFMIKLKLMLNFCQLSVDGAEYLKVSVHISYSISIQNNCASINECFTDPIFGNFSVERKRETRQKRDKAGSVKEEGRAAEGEVSYSVSSDLQVT